MKKLLALLLILSVSAAHGYSLWPFGRKAQSEVPASFKNKCYNVAGEVREQVKDWAYIAQDHIQEHPYAYAVPVVIATVVIAHQVAKKYSDWYKGHCCNVNFSLSKGCTQCVSGTKHLVAKLCRTRDCAC